MLRDRVVVDDAGFHSRTGVWGLSAVHDVAYNDVQTVRVISETTRTRRGGKRTNDYFLCEMKAGNAVKFP